MWFRALQDFACKDARGRDLRIRAGQLVDIVNRHEAARLLVRGYIGPKREPRPADGRLPNAPARSTRPRIGIWMHTSPHYSGGRLHVWQYALCLARNGAEVFIFTDRAPAWADDYRPHDRLRVLTARARVPADIDVVVTDSKGDLGREALRYAEQMGRPLVAWNFETPNWVQQYAPDYARRLEAANPPDVVKRAQFFIANSPLSLEYLRRWVDMPDAPGTWLPPAINTDALERALRAPQDPRRRGKPYMARVGRSSDYKGADTAWRAVCEVDAPLDLVNVGQQIRGTPAKGHELVNAGQVPDEEKFRVLRDAVAVLAPSRFEGFGMVPMEALAVGTPCIVYDLPVLRDAYGDRLVYVPNGDERAFARAVADLAAKPRRVPDRDRAWAVRTYGLDAMARRLEGVPYHVTRRPAVSAHMICYATPTAVDAVQAVYPHVDEIIIAYGPTTLWKDYPERGVLEQLRAMDDPDGKITIEARPVWADKLEMRSWVAAHVRGNRQLLLDADEIWVGLDRWLEADPPFGSPRWVTLWHDLDHWIVDTPELNSGRRWGYPLEPFGSVCPHYRWSVWRGSYRFLRHPTPVDASGNRLYDLDTSREAAEQVPECVIYHLGHALPRDLMEQKHTFYERRDGSPRHRREAWHRWQPGQVGECADGLVKKVTWPIPEQVRCAFQRMIGAGGKARCADTSTVAT